MLDKKLIHTENAGADRRGSRGFTLTETLVALLIVVVLTGLVMTGIPVAFNTYIKVVSDANAQVALSATTSALRDELGLAVNTELRNGTLYYQMSNGDWASIDNGSKGLQKTVYPSTGMSFNPSNHSDPVSLIPDEAIAEAIGGKQLKVQLKSGGISYSNGVFTVSGVEVYLDGSVIESVEPYDIKALFLK